MSVIVRNEDGQIFVLCKGADKYVIAFNHLNSNSKLNEYLVC